MPIVVLINHNTASAAEILTSALAEHHVATIVGTRSFGKGTFQEVIRLTAGGALDLTIGKYFTANGTSLLGKGITPDVKVQNNEGHQAGRAATEGARRAGREHLRREPVSPRRGAGLGRRVASVERRGRFTVVEPLFERGPQATLAGGPRVGPGSSKSRPMKFTLSWKN